MKGPVEAWEDARHHLAQRDHHLKVANRVLDPRERVRNCQMAEHHQLDLFDNAMIVLCWALAVAIPLAFSISFFLP